MQDVTTTGFLFYLALAVFGIGYAIVGFSSTPHPTLVKAVAVAAGVMGVLALLTLL